MPTTKTDNLQCEVEFFDGVNTYFAKKAIINAQGSSSLNFVKKNIAVDFVEDEWIGDETPSISIGDWISQDSFHLKAYYIDNFRGTGAVAYKLYDQISKTRGDMARIWQRAGITDANPKAVGHPHGFPVIVYLNGDFYGVFAFQLKKHRDNYGLKKNEATNIHLDGKISNGSMFNGKIDWTAFEVRAPKTLITVTGEEYDGENPSELIDPSCETFLSSDKKHKRSYETKQYIQHLSEIIPALKALKESGADEAAIREEIERRFDVIGLIDYICFSHITNNNDGFAKNWQWITYDGDKWFVAPYDLDCTFGYYYNGNLLTPWYISGTDLTVGMLNPNQGISTWIQQYYHEEIKTRYQELRLLGIFNVDNIMNLFHDWTERVGDEFYAMERQKWPQSPCWNPAEANAGWEIVDDWHDYLILPPYDAEKEYQEGEMCTAKNHVWRATQTIKGVEPNAKLGFTDSLERLESWIHDRMTMCDAFFDYDPFGDIVKVEEIISADSSERIYTLEGLQIPELRKGVNIIVKAGKAHKVII